MARNITRLYREDAVLPTSVVKTSSSREMVKETNEIEMEMSESGIYHCTVHVPLQRKMSKRPRLGPFTTFNKESNNQKINELLIYSGVFP